MQDIISKLQKWKDSTENSSFETISTITLNSNTLHLTVSGDSLENAYSQIAHICGVLADTKVETVQPSTAPATSFSNSNNNNSVTPISTPTTSILNAFGDKKPIRIYNPAVPLSNEESIIEYNGLTYVVK